MAWDSETGLIFIFKIMKKGSIVKGLFAIGIFDDADDKYYHVIHPIFNKRHYNKCTINIKHITIPTRKEKELYKKNLLKYGYSYYRGKVTKEL